MNKEEKIKEEIEEKERRKRGVIIILSFLVVGAFFGGLFLSDDFSDENALLKTILKADYDFSKVSIDSQMAEQYYSEAGYAYENQDYRQVESNCRLAREYYSEEAQGYERIKAEVEATEIEDELIYIYTDIMEEIIDATYNLFEACEYFESAARYYYTYFETDVPYDDVSFDMGTSEIDGMNEKIAAHDEAIKRYNRLLEEFRTELEKRI